MKKLFGLFFFLLLCFTLSAVENTLPKATVYLYGQIKPVETKIIVKNEVGEELEGNDLALDFDFPATSEWTVSRKLSFYYSSHLASAATGKLTFTVSNLENEGLNSLLTTFILVPASSFDTYTEGTSFITTFLSGYQEEVKIGDLTLRVQKTANDIFTAGVYSGSFSINYTDGP